jgi:co-chaperonin GroES (HSP10)
MSDIQQAQITPTGWRILIKPVAPQEHTSESGLVIPDMVKDRVKHFQKVAEVVELGTEAYQHPKFSGGAPWCKAGDYIIYNSFSGVTIKGKLNADDAEETYLKFINDDEVLAITSAPDTIDQI